MSQVAFHLAIEDIEHGQDSLNAAIHDAEDNGWMDDERAITTLDRIKAEKRRKAVRLQRLQYARHETPAYGD